MFICKICKKPTPSYSRKILYHICDNCEKNMPAFRRRALRRTDSLGDYIGTLPSGGRVFVPTTTYNINEEISNLENEIWHLKSLITKKYQRIEELKQKRALQEQEERHKKELQEMKVRIRRETLFLIKNIGTNDSDSETDGLFAKSAEEHLSSLCSDNNK